MIVLSAAGMLNGGRILHHLNLDPKNSPPQTCIDALHNTAVVSSTTPHPKRSFL
jgi:hypothetical protein